MKELVEQYKDVDDQLSITLAGYSMGSPLVTLAATDIVYNGLNQPQGLPADKTILVTVFAFASPRPGDQGFADAFSALHDLNLRLLRVRNTLDKVPDMPYGTHYKEVGKQQLTVDASQSPFLKEDYSANWMNAHQLQLYLHAVSGFDPKLYQLVLINKHSDALKEEYRDHDLVNWWIERNNSMVQLEDGSWVFDDHESDDE